MADLTVTPADVGLADNQADTKRVQFGEAVTQGMPVYKHTNGKYYKAQNDGTAAEADAKGVAIDAAGADGYGYIVGPEGKYKPGATVAVGTMYAVSNAAGGVCPIADVTSGRYVTPLGVATGAAEIDLNIHASGVQKA